MNLSQSDLEQRLAAQEDARRPQRARNVRPNLINPVATEHEMPYGALTIAGVDNFDIIGAVSMPVYANAYLEGERKDAWKDYLIWRLNLSQEHQNTLDTSIIKEGANAYRKVFQKVFGKTETEAKELVNTSAYELMVKGWDSFSKLKILPDYSVTEGLEANMENAELVAARIDLLLSLYRMMTGKKNAGVNDYERFLAEDMNEEEILNIPYQRRDEPAQEQRVTPESDESNLEEMLDNSAETSAEAVQEETAFPQYLQDADTILDTNVAQDNMVENEPIHNVQLTQIPHNDVEHVETQPLVQRRYNEEEHNWTEENAQ